MGLSMRLNLFHGVAPEDVYAALGSFYRLRGQRLVDRGDLAFGCVLHQQDSGWTLLSMHGESFQGLRHLLLHVSGELGCNGFLIAVHDGAFWGYEFSSAGASLDHFIQHPDHRDSGVNWFPGELCAGNADILAQHLPALDRNVLARYLVRYPAWEEWRHKEDWKGAYRDLIAQRNVKARPDDECLPFNECAVLDFSRYLGLSAERRDGWISFAAPVWHTFWVSGQNTRAAWNKKRHSARQR